MKHIYQLVEEHIREHESRLTHMDELLERARNEAGERTEDSETKTQLADLELKRDMLASHIDKLKLKSLDDWRKEEIDKAGPMGIWDAVAQQLEKLVERVER